MRTHTIVDSPGDLTVVAEDGALTGLYFVHHRRGPAVKTLGARSDVGFEEARRQLGEYFTGERHEFDLPLAPAGAQTTPVELGRACQGHGGSAFLR